jgi:tetratricopeptide (TPR) repeat protein/transcriptional regulator with XRE-family HTH domain
VGSGRNRYDCGKTWWRRWVAPQAMADTLGGTMGGEGESGALARIASTVWTLPELAELLRQLRRRHARQQSAAELTYRELAAKTGWSQAAVAEYFGGKALPPTDRLDDLVRLLGATPREQGALATARDRIEERRRAVPSPAAGAPTGLVPRQLPAAARHIAGRRAELAMLDALAAATPTATVIATIVGTAGIGKTALAVCWAHRAAGRFPDGQLHANLHGFDPEDHPADPAEIMRRFLEACAVPPQHLPAGLDALTAMYRSVLAGRRMLVLLDNAATAEQVRPLLPGAPGCLVLVTSRDRLPGLTALDGARTLTLDLLTPAEARHLLVWHLGEERVAASPGAVEEIIARSAGLPLALTILAAQAATHPTLALRAIAGELRAAVSVLDILDGGDSSIDMRAVFSWSYRHLSAEAARLFRLLGLHSGPDITAPAAASLAGVPATRVQPVLTELDRACLITQHRPGRYAVHDLLRTYAMELVRDGQDDRDQATGRLLDHYLHTAYRATMLLDPHRDPLTLDEPHPGVDTERHADQDDALAWFEMEQANLLALIESAADGGRSRQAWQLSWTILIHLRRRGRVQENMTAQRAAFAAAARLADPAARAMTHRLLANAHIGLGEFGEAHAQLRQALQQYQRLDNRTGQGHVNHDLSLVYGLQHRDRDALRHAQVAVDTFAGHYPVAYARALNSVGMYHAHLGEYSSAISACEQALAELRRRSDPFGQALTWDSLGYAYHHLGQYHQAADSYRHAVDLFHEIGDRLFEARTLISLGDMYHAAGQSSSARATWHRAREILDDLNHPDVQRVHSRLS